MYDPFANPVVPPGQVQTTAAPPGQMPNPSVQSALAAFMAKYQNQPWAQQWAQQRQQQFGQGQSGNDWRDLQQGAHTAFKDARQDWRGLRPNFGGNMARPADAQQQMTDWRADRPQWMGWGG